MAKARGRVPRVGQEKKLKEVLEKSPHGDFYWHMSLLWPNVQPILVRLSRYVGQELCLDKSGKTFLEQILCLTKKEVDQAQKQGKVRQKGRDRDLLVFFLRGVLYAVMPIYKYRISVNGLDWQFGYESFQPWRQSNPGALEVKKLKSKSVDNDMEKSILRRIARLILTEKDWAILDDDAERLWSQDGIAANPDEFKFDPGYESCDLPDNVISLTGRLN